MLRSLVGSEMCIRDRLSTDLTLSDEEVVRIYGKRWDIEVFFKMTKSYLCLLYTSDAADDLLCVDLGGRRIIKKKNRTDNDNRTHKKDYHS